MALLAQHRIFITQWVPAVIFVFLPFFIFLGLIDFFSPVGIETVNNNVKSALPALINLSGETALQQLIKLEASFIQYSGLLLVHILISLVLLTYFWNLFTKRLKSLEKPTTPPRFFYNFLIFFNIFVAAVLFLTIYSNHSFAHLMVRTPEMLMTLSGAWNHTINYPAYQDHLFKWALLLPVIICSPAIIMASAHCHLCFFIHFMNARQEPYPNKPNNGNPNNDNPNNDDTGSIPSIAERGEVVKLIKQLYNSVIRMSILLVSAVIIANAYFKLLPGSLTAQADIIDKAYMPLAQALTFSCGLFFTVILCAVFLPGGLFIINYINRQRIIERHPIELTESLKKNGLDINIIPIVKIVGALLAPALTGPLLDMFSSLASAI